MKNTYYFILILALLFGACSGGQQNEAGNEEKAGQDTATETTQAQTGAPEKAATEEGANFTLKKFEWDMAQQVDYTGELVYGKAWEDKNGDNLLVFSEKYTHNEPEEGPGSSDIELHAYHYADKGSGYKLLREIKDFERGCGFENRARFIDASVTISDVDYDKYGEATFVYYLGCSSDISPDGLKLMMLENGDKYAIRGKTLVELGPDTFGGDTNIDPSFEQAPEGFLDHARKIWDDCQKHNEYWYEVRDYMQRKYDRYLDISFFGVEPNWKVKLYEDYFTYHQTGFDPSASDPVRYNIKRIDPLTNGIDVQGKKQGGRATISLYITKETCSDGMSENDYPFKIRVSTSKGNHYGCGRGSLRQ